MVPLLRIPLNRGKTCSLVCGHGHCLKYVNSDNVFCQYEEGWPSSYCSIKHECKCSSKSLCIQPSICVCPIGIYGLRCYLMASPCQPGKCQYGGSCAPNDGHVSEWHYTCICPTGYSGDVCQTADSRIDISFQSNVKISPLSPLVRFITVRAGPAPIRASMLRRIANLIAMQELNTPSTSLSTKSFHLNVTYPFKSFSVTSFLQCIFFRRTMYYHLPCQERPDLRYFFDKVHMCLCNEDRHSNCFDFNHEMKYDCQGTRYYQNGADCFQDHSPCPRTLVCVCRDW